MPRVPTTKEVVPGAAVNIVLKADQPTGRTVSGTIGDVLTRGNHPRGIKVRLADGRVGRVQSMATGSTVTEQQHVQDGAQSLEDSSRISTAARDGGNRFRDDRAHRLAEDSLPSQETGLDAYVTYAKARGRKGKAHKANAPTGSSSGAPSAQAVEAGIVQETGPTESGTVACPVCGDFEGDETAVAHHVASHFEN